MDPRLNSIHLEANHRREQFRAARERLLQAHGLGHRPDLDPALVAPSGADLTCVLPACGALPKYALMEHNLVYPLKEGLNTIGRMSDNDIVLPDRCISRRHCAIVVDAEGRCVLHDTASKNGTYLNGRKLTAPVRLQPGDAIQICDRRLTLVKHPAVASADDSHTIPA
ncbi:MAG: FHA domain-containing protein [Gemmataceae bacterium]|nr:FHA domain-containing protein [Gemmataceae bacterium]MDW8264285.1 FHA domain-containing protein [Gemmataceae bacterium]